MSHFLRFLHLGLSVTANIDQPTESVQPADPAAKDYDSICGYCTLRSRSSTGLWPPPGLGRVEDTRIIAAACLSRSLSICVRNVRSFSSCELNTAYILRKARCQY